jgi:hypothetical protein
MLSIHVKVLFAKAKKRKKRKKIASLKHISWVVFCTHGKISYLGLVDDEIIVRQRPNVIDISKTS